MYKTLKLMRNRKRKRRKSCILKLIHFAVHLKIPVNAWNKKVLLRIEIIYLLSVKINYPPCLSDSLYLPHKALSKLFNCCDDHPSRPLTTLITLIHINSIQLFFLNLHYFLLISSKNVISQLDSSSSKSILSMYSYILSYLHIPSVHQ